MITPRELLNAWQIRASKRHGQNFLSNPSLAEKIVDAAAVASTDVVLEIGAGLGALTVPLSRKAKWVYAVEPDRRLIHLLQTELTAHEVNNVRICQQDILSVDAADLAGSLHCPLVAVGNLPYHISSQILVYLIENRAVIRRAVLMFQKELAQRLTAGPGSRAYGRLSVMLQYCADVRSLLSVNADQFFPVPKIASELIGIELKPPRGDVDESFLFKVIRAAFGQRRKTLKNALVGSAFRLSASLATDALRDAGIDPSRRAETLTVDEFITLGSRLAARTDQQPQ